MISNLLDKSNVTFYGANIFKSENFYMYEQYNIQYCFKYKTLNFTETTVTTLQGKGKPFNGHRPYATDVDLRHDTHLKVLRFFQIYSRKSHQGF
jgi:hypothetical protein